MKRILLIGALLLSIAVPVQAIEIVRQKNAATYIAFPITKNDGTLISSATGLDSEIDTWADGSAPDGFTDCTNEATEIGTSGQYYLSLTQTEMNVDYAIIQIKSTSTGALIQTVLIRTTVGDPLNYATTDDGGTINVTGGAIDTVTTTGTATAVTTVNGLAANVITATSINSGAITSAKFASGAIDATAIATDAIGSAELSQAAADKVWGTTTRALTDKAGFTISGTLTTLDSQYQRVNTAQAGAAGSITLDASASATNSLYNGAWVSIVSGTGVGQARLITGYTGSTKMATVTPNWTTNPASGSVFIIRPAGHVAGVNGNVTGSVASVTGAVGSVTGAVGSVTGAVGSVTGSVGSVTGAVGSVTAGVTVTTNNDKTGYSLTQSFPSNFVSLAITGGGAVTVGTNNDKTGYSISGTKTTLDALNDITVAGVWDEAISGHLGAGSTGAALNAAGSAGDPWTTPLPGAYGSGTAGKIVGDNLNATVSSRATQASVDIIDDFVDTEVAAIKAVTDQFAFTTANQVDARVLTNSDKTGYSLSAAGIDAIFDEVLSGHTDPGSLGKILSDEVNGLRAYGDNNWQSVF